MNDNENPEVGEGAAEPLSDQEIKTALQDLEYLGAANIALSGLINAIVSDHWLMGVLLSEYSRRNGFDLGEWVNKSENTIAD
jgi:hypothetical protein